MGATVRLRDGVIAIGVAGVWAGTGWAAGGPWAGWRPASCMPAECFCEAIRPGLVAQPANTWSNVAFVVVGLLIIAHGGTNTARRPVSPITRRGSAAVYGAAAVVTGLGSMFYHASLTFVGQFCDVLGMYLFAAFILLYAVGRVRPLGGRTFVIAYVALNAALAWLLITVPGLRRWLFAALLLAALACESRAQRAAAHIDARWLWAAVATLAVAFVIWILDLTKVLCVPESWVQGHAAWHILGAVAVGCGYLYYRSERPVAVEVRWQAR